MSNDTLSRRGFLFGATATAACGVARAAGVGGTEGHDAALSVFLSDIHIAKPGLDTIWGKQPSYQNAMLSKTVDEILTMRPLPARAVCFGDVALWFGWSGDYEIAIEEGATVVRVGQAIFGARALPDSHYWPENKAQNPSGA